MPSAWPFAASGIGGRGAIVPVVHGPGVPGDRFSNMGPPTLCIVALCLLQVGLVVGFRPVAVRSLERPRAQRAVEWATHRSMTVYLWHFVGFTLAYALLWMIGLHAPQASSAVWWAERPLYVVVPAAATVPLVRAFSRFDGAGVRRSSIAPPDRTPTLVAG